MTNTRKCRDCQPLRPSSATHPDDRLAMDDAIIYRKSHKRLFPPSSTAPQTPARYATTEWSTHPCAGDPIPANFTPSHPGVRAAIAPTFQPQPHHEATQTHTPYPPQPHGYAPAARRISRSTRGGRASRDRPVIPPDTALETLSVSTTQTTLLAPALQWVQPSFRSSLRPSNPCLADSDAARQPASQPARRAPRPTS